MIEEEIKLIPDYPGYAVSNLGYVFNLETGKQLKGARKKTGYYEVCLTIDKKQHFLLLHRIVAEVFCKRPFGCFEVNHKDGNKDNNTAENLEWVTHEENLKHAFNTGLRDDDVSPRIVIATNMEDGTEIEFRSIYYAARFFNISKGNICMCCQGKRPYANGYFWRYKHSSGEEK